MLLKCIAINLVRMVLAYFVHACGVFAPASLRKKEGVQVVLPTAFLAIGLEHGANLQALVLAVCLHPPPH